MRLDVTLDQARGIPVTVAGGNALSLDDLHQAASMVEEGLDHRRCFLAGGVRVEGDAAEAGVVIIASVILVSSAHPVYGDCRPGHHGDLLGTSDRVSAVRPLDQRAGSLFLRIG